MDYFTSVKQFHMNKGLGIRFTPTIPSKDEQDLRARLLQEEVEEVLSAPTLGNLAQELADIIYIVCGTALVYGIDLDAAFAEVHKANMSKTAGHKREDGKILKGPKYKAPDVATAIGLVKDVNL